jgi:dTDP-4-amino-4,6-dideoxygalactose transaminase
MKAADLLHGLAGMLFGKRYAEKLENEIRQRFGARHVFFVSSGKAALTLILTALKEVTGKKQVVIPAYTCFSVPSSIIRAGLEIVPCDVDSTSLDFDYGLLEKTAGPDTLCVVSSHLFGMPSDVERVKRLCRDREIFVVEDAAQAMGQEHNGKMLGTIGDVGFFSLGRGKNITCGSGGIIVTNSDQIAGLISRQVSELPDTGPVEDLVELVQFGLMALFIRPGLYWFPEGLPFLKLGQTEFNPNFRIKKLSGMKAGLLRSWRERLDRAGRARAETAAYFHGRPGVKALWRGSVSYLRLPVVLQSRKVRDEIVSNSGERGLGVSKMYPTAVHEIQEIRENFNGRSYPSASRIAEGLLALPTHQYVTEKDKEEICKLFGQISHSGRGT